MKFITSLLFVYSVSISCTTDINYKVELPVENVHAINQSDSSLENELKFNISDVIDGIDDLIDKGLLLTLESNFADINSLDSIKNEINKLVSNLTFAQSLIEIDSVFKVKKPKHISFIISEDSKVAVVNWTINFANIRFEPYHSVFFISKNQVFQSKLPLTPNNLSLIVSLQSMEINSVMTYFLLNFDFDFFGYKQSVFAQDLKNDTLQFSSVFIDNTYMLELNSNIELHYHQNHLTFQKLGDNKNNNHKITTSTYYFDGIHFVLKKN